MFWFIGIVFYASVVSGTLGLWRKMQLDRALVFIGMMLPVFVALSPIITAVWIFADPDVRAKSLSRRLAFIPASLYVNLTEYPDMAAFVGTHAHQRMQELGANIGVKLLTLPSEHQSTVNRQSATRAGRVVPFALSAAEHFALRLSVG